MIDLPKKTSDLDPGTRSLGLCYHCGSDLEPGHLFTEVLGGQARQFCCAGCLAIAQTIHGQGLDAFYARRIPLGSRPKDPGQGQVGQVPESLLAYDDPSLVARFSRPLDSESRIITLRLEKIRCAACVWLNEQHLRRQPGVLDVQMNYVTQRAQIKYQPEKIRISEILYAVEMIGYEAWPFEPSLAAETAKKERRQLLMRLGVAVLGMMQVMMYAWPTYTNAEDLIAEHALLLSWTSWLLTVPVVVYSAGPMFKAAWHSLRLFPQTKMLGMDVPVTLAIGLAFLAGTMTLVTQSGDSYFDSITMFVAFLLTARYVELLARQDAQGGAEALAKQLPATCERLENFPSSGQGVIVPVVKCQIGDVIRVGPGELIALDGEILAGQSQVDESLLTGESRPVAKSIGDHVYAGSHNIQSPITLRVTAVGQATRIAGIAQLLDQALASKPQLLGLAEKWAGYFVVFLMLAALMTGVIWFYVDSSRAWEIAVAVLVASCPCALSLATPAAMAAAQGAVTRLGLLVVRGHAMETLAKITDCVFDKTGTLTTGIPHLADIKIVRTSINETTALQIAAALEEGHNHPLALAILRAAQEKNIEPLALGHLPVAEVGKGVMAGNYRLGSPQWIGVDLHDWAIPEHYSPVCLADESGLLAIFMLSDTVREGALDLIQTLKNQGITVHLVSGDHPATVAWWAQYLGIAAYQGAALPEEKYQYLNRLQSTGAVVAAIGDGVNDAPLLAKANISIAVGSGAPLAQAGADAILTQTSLKVISQAMSVAQRGKTIMQQNLVWAFIYNVIAIPVAMLGWINPWIAGIGMSLSSLAVTLNAWRLRKIT